MGRPGDCTQPAGSSERSSGRPAGGDPHPPLALLTLQRYKSKPQTLIAAVCLFAPHQTRGKFAVPVMRIQGTTDAWEDERMESLGYE